MHLSTASKFCVVFFFVTLTTNVFSIQITMLTDYVIIGKVAKPRMIV